MLKVEQYVFPIAQNRDVWCAIWLIYSESRRYDGWPTSGGTLHRPHYTSLGFGAVERQLELPGSCVKMW